MNAILALIQIVTFTFLFFASIFEWFMHSYLSRFAANEAHEQMVALVSVYRSQRFKCKLHFFFKECMYVEKMSH